MLRRNKNKNSRVSTLPEESPPYQFMNLEFLSPYIQDFKKHRNMYLICCNKTNKCSKANKTLASCDVVVTY